MNTYRPVAERIKDFDPVEVPLDENLLEQELKRCQDCGVPFCHAAGCPLSNIIPEINAEVLAGRWEAALARLLATSPFPEFTSRVCPALCEGSCVQGLNERAVPCRKVEYAVIERGFSDSLVQARPPRQRLDIRAAVVGSGPSGLAAAWRLNQAGVQVTVYEKDAKPGGFMRYGIPDFKLDKAVLDRRVALLEAEGIRFECGVEAGVDISERLLRHRHELVILAAGARRKRDLDVPGRDLMGVHFATEYLSAQNRVLGREAAGLPDAYNARGKKVVVIGGGDTGSDCVGTAWRQGALSVWQIEIMPMPPERREAFNPWPEWPRTLRTSSSHEEGCERRWNITTAAFLPAPDAPGRLGALHCREVAWEKEGARLIRPLPVDGSDMRLETDLALLALGFTGVEESPLLSGLGIQPDRMGRLDRDASGRISEGLYVCGDAATGPGLVVRAIADGLKTAEEALKTLPGLCSRGV